MTYNFNSMNLVYRKKNTANWKNIIQITFNFVEEGPGRGSEDIKKECNVKCFGFFFFPVSLMDVTVEKITINLKELQQNRKKKEETTRTPEKS